MLQRQGDFSISLTCSLSFDPTGGGGEGVAVDRHSGQVFLRLRGASDSAVESEGIVMGIMFFFAFSYTKWYNMGPMCRYISSLNILSDIGMFLLGGIALAAQAIPPFPIRIS